MKLHSLILASALGALAVHAAPPSKVTWLGLTTREAPPVVAEQLDLPKSTGLVVEMVLPDSPAATAGVLTNDLLTKLDDQLLINPSQLAVLVRNKKPGDKVTLTLLRKGKPQTITAKLGEHEAPPLPAFGNIEVQGLGGCGQLLPLGQMLPGASVVIQGLSGDGAMSTSQFSDGEHSITIQVRDGQKTITVTGKDGKTIFSGPYNTDEEKAKLPAEVRPKIEQMEENQKRIPQEMLVPPGLNQEQL